MWTSEEISRYRQLPDVRLTRLYANSGISENDPEARFVYLKKFILRGLLNDEDILCLQDSCRGRDSVLEKMEQMTITHCLDQPIVWKAG